MQITVNYSNVQMSDNANYSSYRYNIIKVRFSTSGADSKKIIFFAAKHSISTNHKALL